MSDDSDRKLWNEAYEEDPDGAVVADQFLAEEVAGLEPGTALDLGCGSGPNALMLAGLGWSVLGVDWAERAIELARQAARELGLEATFVVGDLAAWRPRAQFDLVISTYALPGGEATRRVLEMARETLAPGGTLIVAEWDASMAEVWGLAEGDLISAEEIVAALHGLEIETAEVRGINDPFGAGEEGQEGTGAAANVAFVRARRPALEPSP